METKNELKLYSQDFTTWFGDREIPKRQVTQGYFLQKANRISEILFKKPFYQCQTFQQRYIAKMIAKRVF